MSKLIYLLYVVILVLVSSCDNTVKDGELRVGISADYPPFDMMIDGEVAGFDADIALLVAKKLNKTLIIKEIDFNSLMPALDSDIIDIAISNISKTEERAKNYDFSVPYYRTEAFLVTNISDKSKLEDFKSLKIGVQSGSIFESQLINLGYKIKPFARLTMMVEDLKAGNVEAILLDGPQVKSIIEMYPNFKSIEAKEIVDQGISIALKKDSEMTEKINKIIESAHKSGEINKIYQKWLIDFQTKENSAKIFGIKIKYFKVIAEGIGLTLQFSLISTILGLLIATFLTILSGMSRFFQAFSNLYVSILRGTPLILQLSIIYFAIPSLIGTKFSVFSAGIIAFSMNSAAYVYEHLKAGINGIEKGQIEAATALGMTKLQIMKLIVVPQALRNIVPSLINEAINMVKESSIVSIVGAQDIMRKAQLVSSESYDYLTPLLIAGIYYYLIINIMNFVLIMINKKLAR